MFKPADTIKELTMKKLKETIKFVYGDHGYYDIVTEDYFVVMLGFIQEKHRNLRWLFGDKLRIEVSHKFSYITLDDNEKELLNLLAAFHGVEVSQVLTDIKTFISSFISAPLDQHKVTKCITQLSRVNNSMGPLKTSAAPLKNGVVQFINGSFLFVPYSRDRLSVSFSSIEYLDVNSSNKSWLSIEPSDMLLAANGSNTRSCHQISGSYHLGAVANCMTDFAMIHYQESSTRHNMKGRQLIWAPMTKHGVPTTVPLVRSQYAYGSFSKGASEAVVSLIVTKFKEFFKSDIEFDFFAQSVSTSMVNQVYQNRAGYLDEKQNSGSLWLKPKTFSFYTDNKLPLFNFEQPIWFDGTKVVNGSLRKGDNPSPASRFGISNHQIVNTTSGNRVLASQSITTEDGEVLSLEELIEIYKISKGTLTIPDTFSTEPDTDEPVIADSSYEVQDEDIADF